jgi:hypothetical protein
MIEKNLEFSFIKQIDFLQNVQHYSRTGSSEDRETLYDLVESINKLGIEIIPEVASIISEISSMNQMSSSAITYNPTRLSNKAVKTIEVLNKKLDKIRESSQSSYDRTPLLRPNFLE